MDIQKALLSKKTGSPVFGIQEYVYAKTLGGGGGDYTALEYIESSGAQRIDVDYFPISACKVSVDYALTKLPDTTVVGNEVIIGGYSRTGSSVKNLYWLIEHSDGPKRLIYNAVNGWYNTAIGSCDLNRHTCVTINRTCTLDGIQHTMSGSPVTSATEGSTLTLFATSDYETGSGDLVYGAYAYMRLYSCQITASDGETLVRDFVPVKTNKQITDYWGNEQPANSIGLFDNVSQKFFPNQGTGEFVGQ